MQTFLVGGIVRDGLMDVTPKDRDFLVVGVTREEMDSLKSLTCVGKDFPVWIDRLGQQYSLARRSRNGGVADFGPEVTLEEDLAKRDLTINAMARDIETDELFDPHGGQADIQNKVLRMVSAEAFSEDPVRVLRVARFAARYPKFTIDPATMQHMRVMVLSNDLDCMVPERVWGELAKGLMERKPSRMLQVLRECGALKVILPEIDRLYGVPQPEAHHPEIDTGIHIEQVLDHTAVMCYGLPIRFAALMHDVGKGLTSPEFWPSHYAHEVRGVEPVAAWCEKMRVPGECADLAVLATREHGRIHSAMAMKTSSIVRGLRQCDAFRRPERFFQLLSVAEADARGRIGKTGDFSERDYAPAKRWVRALSAAQAIKGGEIAAAYQDKPQHIPAALHAARARAVRADEATWLNPKKQQQKESA